MHPTRSLLPWCLIPALLSAAARATADDAPVGISVTGHAVFRLSPDRATVVVGIHSESGTAAEALHAAQASLTGFLEALHPLDIAADHIRTGTMSLEPTYPTGPGGVVIMTCDETIEVSTDTLSQVGPIIAAVGEQGLNRIDSVQYDLRDRTAAYLAVVHQATIRARDRARTIADGLGVTLGPPLSVSDQDDSPVVSPRPFLMHAMVAGAPRARMGEALAPPLMQGGDTTGDSDLQPGQITIAASVTAVFQIAGTPPTHP